MPTRSPARFARPGRSGVGGEGDAEGRGVVARLRLRVEAIGGPVVVDEHEIGAAAAEIGDPSGEWSVVADAVIREFDARRAGGFAGTGPDEVERRAFRGRDQAKAELGFGAQFPLERPLEPLERP